VRQNAFIVAGVVGLVAIFWVATATARRLGRNKPWAPTGFLIMQGASLVGVVVFGVWLLILGLISRYLESHGL
jgi:hypothetical protein